MVAERVDINGPGIVSCPAVVSFVSARPSYTVTVTWSGFHEPDSTSNFVCGGAELSYKAVLDLR